MTRFAFNALVPPLDEIGIEEGEIGNSKKFVRLATAAALPAASGTKTGTLEGTVAAALEVDSVKVAVNNRILVKNQAAAVDNGIYEVVQAGKAGEKWKITRTSDANSESGLLGASVYVELGQLNAAKTFSLYNAPGFTVNTTSLVWLLYGAGTNTPSPLLTQVSAPGKIILGKSLILEPVAGETFQVEPIQTAGGNNYLASAPPTLPKAVVAGNTLILVACRELSTEGEFTSGLSSVTSPNAKWERLTSITGIAPGGQSLNWEIWWAPNHPGGKVNDKVEIFTIEGKAIEPANDWVPYIMEWGGVVAVAGTKKVEGENLVIGKKGKASLTGLASNNRYMVFGLWGSGATEIASEKVKGLPWRRLEVMHSGLSNTGDALWQLSEGTSFELATSAAVKEGKWSAIVIAFQMEAGVAPLNKNGQVEARRIEGNPVLVPKAWENQAASETWFEQGAVALQERETTLQRYQFKGQIKVKALAEYPAGETIVKVFSGAPEHKPERTQIKPMMVGTTLATAKPQLFTINTEGIVSGANNIKEGEIVWLDEFWWDKT